MFTTDDQRNRLFHLERKLQTLLTAQQVLWTPKLVDDLMLDPMMIVTEEDITQDTSSLNSRQKILGKAINLMKESEQDILPISDICEEVGGSWRTTERAFLEKFGIGPKAYYNRLRLNKVREDLLADPDTPSISYSANTFDFWHMGQFARDYRQMFGQLPSETLSGRS